MKYLGNVVNAYKIIANDYLKPGMTVIDATCGNGNDALFLKQKITHSGRLYAIDIQNDAIESTRALLKTNGYDEDENLVLKQCSHETFDFLKSEEVDFIIYNLGYLPKGDKSIVTHFDTTLKSLNSAMYHLKHGGLIFILCYRGHEEGAEEFIHMNSFLANLSQSEFDVLKMAFTNQKNTPPLMWIVERK
ncbi:tRNA (mnm(5)s(2)U34)-methyltransferase [Fusibacter ferrireducens]|uniref:Methyltransferase domain-containing protein n=1 Tax=Fusibacter ferrireducens TaxID=2785058 RepID=A0ABR9ZVM2_9FIRM|nr:class I SAM-dependent methyltransferase [Fusibacter ferrireducens]MBF4693664.1 methyltransferase domain-containing protein [Fusibacter ferrireducens]